MRIFKLLFSVLLLAQLASAQETTVPVFLLRPSPTAGQLLHTPSGVGARPAWTAGLIWDGTDLTINSNTVQHTGNRLWDDAGGYLQPRLKTYTGIQLGDRWGGDFSWGEAVYVQQKDRQIGLVIRPSVTHNFAGDMYGYLITGQYNSPSTSFDGKRVLIASSNITMNNGFFNQIYNHYSELKLNSVNVQEIIGSYSNITLFPSSNARQVQNAYLYQGVLNLSASTNTTNNTAAVLYGSMAFARGTAYGIYITNVPNDKTGQNFGYYNDHYLPVNLNLANRSTGIFNFIQQRGKGTGSTAIIGFHDVLNVNAQAGATSNTIVNYQGIRIETQNNVTNNIVSNWTALNVLDIANVATWGSDVYGLRVQGPFMHNHLRGGLSIGATDSRTQGRLLVTGADTLATSFILRARNSNNAEAFAVTGLRTVGVRTTVPSETLFVNGSFGANERSGTATSIAGWSSSNKAVNVTTGAGIDFSGGVLSTVDQSATNEAQSLTTSSTSTSATSTLSQVSGSGGGSLTLQEGTGIDLSTTSNTVTINALDASSTNEVQSLSNSHTTTQTTTTLSQVSGTGGGSLTLIEGIGIDLVGTGNQVTISALDGSATNEAQTFSGSNSSGNALLSLTSVSGSGGGSYTLIPGTGVTFTHAANQVTINASAGGRTDFVIAGANTTVDSIGSGSWRRYTINADSSLWSVTSGQMWPNLVTKTNIGIRGLAATDTTTNSLVVSSGPAVLYGRYSNSNTNASRSYITAGASYGATANTPGLLFSVGDQSANGKSWRLAGAGNELRFSLYADGGTGTEVPFLTLRRNGLLPAFAIAQARVLVNKTTWGNRGRLEVNGAIHADTLKASLGAGTAGHIFTTYNTLGDGRWAPIIGTNGVSVTWNGTSTVITGPGTVTPIDSILWSLNTSQASVFPKSTRKVSIGRAAPLNSYLLSVEAGTDGLNTWFNSRTTSNLVQFTNTSTGTTTTDGTEVGLINSLFKIQQKEAAAIDLIQGNGSNGGRITFNSTNSLQFRNTSGLIQAFLFQAYGTTTPLLNVDSRINTNQQAVEVGGAVSRNGINRTGSGGTEATIYHRAGARVFDGSTITGTTNNELHIELEETVTAGTGTKRFMIRVHGHSNDPQATSTPNATAFDIVFAKTFVNLTVQPTNTGKDANGGYYENVRWYVSSTGKPVCAFKINDGTTNDFLSAIVIVDTYAINDDGVTLNAPFVSRLEANSGSNL